MPSFSFLDAHTHVQFAAYDIDRDEVISRAQKSGVRFINVGTQRDTSRNAVMMAEKYSEGVYAAIGLHPIHTGKAFHDADELGGGDAAKEFVSRGEIFDHDYYYELGKNSKTVAIGECGLDYYRRDKEQEISDKEKTTQKNVFLEQIELAHEVKKPLMIHCRDAFTDLIALLNDRPEIRGSSNPGVIHFFSGTPDDAKKLLELGFSFTFGGVITFPPRKGKAVGDYDETVKMIPLERILSETDAPYCTPVPYRDKRNEPAYVIHVVKRLAELKNISTEEMAETIARNAKRIFGI
jgi:TatD DNase family protein